MKARWISSPSLSLAAVALVAISLGAFGQVWEDESSPKAERAHFSLKVTGMT